ncbi:MAG: hypothetical protein WC825_02270 [Gallionellaceae bacterium]
MGWAIPIGGRMDCASSVRLALSSPRRLRGLVGEGRSLVRSTRMASSWAGVVVAFMAYS